MEESRCCAVSEYLLSEKLVFKVDLENITLIKL